MAFYPNKKKDPNSLQAHDIAVGLPTPGVLRGTAGGSGAVDSAAAPARGPQGSGRYFDFSRYVEANRGKGAALAQGLAQRVTKTAQGADAAYTNLKNELAAAPGVAAAPTYESVVRDAKGAATPASFSRPGVVAKAPVNVAADVAQRAAEQAASATYTGPRSITELAGYTDAARLGREALSQLDAAGTASGIRAMLPSSSPGLSTLDALLVGAEGGNKKLLDTKQQFSGLRQRMLDAIGDDSAAKEKDAQAEATRAAGRGILERLGVDAQAATNADTARREEEDRIAVDRDALVDWAAKNFVTVGMAAPGMGATAPSFNGFTGNNENFRAWALENEEILRRLRAQMDGTQLPGGSRGVRVRNTEGW